MSTDNKQPPKISAVTSMYRSELYIEAFVETLSLCFRNINCDSYEIVVVNDGSPDGSLDKILKLR